MTAVLFDLILSFGIGVVAALAARVQLRLARSVVLNRWLAGLLIYQALIFSPLAAYVYVLHPAWSWSYLFAPEGLPDWLGLLVVALSTALAVTGWLVTARLLRTRRERQALYLALGAAGALLVVMAITGPRLWWIGSFGQYQGGADATGMVPLPGTRLGWVLGGAVPVGMAVLGYLLWSYQSYGLRLALAEAPEIPWESAESDS